MVKPLKVLESPNRKPAFLGKGMIYFGLKKYHFIEANRVRFKSIYKNKDGEYMFPNYFEVNSKKVQDMAIKGEKYNRKDLYYVPPHLCDIMEEIEEVKNAQ